MMQGLKIMKLKLKKNLKLFKSASKLIYCADYDLIDSSIPDKYSKSIVGN
jgi:hypothetical protein